MENSIGRTIISRPFQKRENFPSIPANVSWNGERESLRAPWLAELCVKWHSKVARIDWSFINLCRDSIIYRRRSVASDLLLAQLLTGRTNFQGVEFFFFFFLFTWRKSFIRHPAHFVELGSVGFLPIKTSMVACILFCLGAPGPDYSPVRRRM